MEMLSCSNCSQPRGFKRRFGLGTLVMILLTLGLWILVMPLYPARCITCGQTRLDALTSKNHSLFESKTFTVIFAVALVGGIITLLRVFLPHSAGPTSPPTSPTSATGLSALSEKKIDHEPASAQPSPRVANAHYQEYPLLVSDNSILSDYDFDEAAAKERYENRVIKIEGDVNGLFVPSPEQALRMASEGHTATSFVTMGGPAPTSSADTLLRPGIVAYSADNSFFGFSGAGSHAPYLGPGSHVNLTCKDIRSIDVSGIYLAPDPNGRHHSITLDSCVADAEKTNSEPQTQAPAPIERRSPAIVTPTQQ